MDWVLLRATLLPLHSQRNLQCDVAARQIARNVSRITAPNSAPSKPLSRHPASSFLCDHAPHCTRHLPSPQVEGPHPTHLKACCSLQEFCWKDRQGQRTKIWARHWSVDSSHPGIQRNIARPPTSNKQTLDSSQPAPHALFSRAIVRSCAKRHPQTGRVEFWSFLARIFYCLAFITWVDFIVSFSLKWPKASRQVLHAVACN